MPKPPPKVDNVKYEIRGRQIKALRSLQMDPAFVQNYKDIRITKEKIKKEDL
jgi:hypothetical protein